MAISKGVMIGIGVIFVLALIIMLISSGGMTGNVITGSVAVMSEIEQEYVNLADIKNDTGIKNETQNNSESK